MNDYIKMLQQANIKIAELEKERDVLTAFIIKRMPPIKAMSSIYKTCKIVSDEVDLILKAHNLEQQAKGINELVAHLKVNTSYLMFTESTFREVESYYDFLLDQAKALKEGK
jgi:hypothetical protein